MEIRRKMGEPREKIRFLKRVRQKRGSIIVSFAVFMIALTAAGALTLDYRMAVTKRHAADHLADMMVLAAMDGFHTDEVFVNKVSQLPAQDEVIARVVCGMSNAQNVYLTAAHSVMNTNELVSPFSGSANWSSEYQELLNWIENEGPVYTFPQDAYSQSKVKFLDGDYRVITPITNANNPLDIRAVKVDLEMKPEAHVEPFFIRVFRRDPLRVGTSSTAEVVNASLTRSLVLAVDRSLSMAHFTGPGPLASSGDKFEHYEHWIQVGDHKIQPMQNLLDAAQILPDALADLNRYRDPELNNSFGIVLFDVFAEALEFRAAAGDRDPYLSHDEDGTKYQEVKDVLTEPLHSQNIPRLLPIGDFDPNDPTCDENHAFGSDPCRHDSPRNLQQFKSHWLSKLNTTGPTTNDLHALRPLADGSALGPFFPWTNTDGSVGLEVAIEILRQERHRFVTLEEHPSETFQAEIAFLSDTVMNTFHDRNILQNGTDFFPTIPTTGSGNIRCDQRGFYGSDTPAYERIVLPASWRQRITQPKFYGDTYHNGNVRLTKSNFNPDNPPSGFEPRGVETNVNDSLVNMVNFARRCATSAGTEAGCCPGPDCMGIVSRLRGFTTSSNTIQPGTSLSCGDVALMDYAQWAEANNIRIHGIGFELAMQSAAVQQTGRFLLDYISDPSKDGTNVGLVFYDTECDPTTGSCAELEEAFRSIGRLLDVRITSNRPG